MTSVNSCQTDATCGDSDRRRAMKSSIDI
jgi:hypothetical protein